MKPANEKQALRAIFADCRTAALGPVLFNVSDGEGWAFERPIDVLDVVEKAVFNIDEATLSVTTPAGQLLGIFYLVMGNAEDGEELICDYGVNTFTDRVFELFTARYT